jgi:hypothetical protein
MSLELADMGQSEDSKPFELLSELLLAPPAGPSTRFVRATDPGAGSAPDRAFERVATLTQGEFDDLRGLATKNHVIMRSFEPLQRMLTVEGKSEASAWVGAAMKEETTRISHALDFLRQICTTLEEDGCPVVVIKSLDHWPDLGSDLDLYTDAAAATLIESMKSHFNASLAERSWGDRLANKWNFIVPGLPELVEVHVGRLGQTGEQTALTRSLASRSQTTERMGYAFRTSAPEDRIVISTLQRMYRHFYIRLCDIADNGHLLDEGLVDFGLLQTLGTASGLWEGIATYLRIVSEYLRAYRGDGVPLPSSVTGAAKFGLDQCHFRKDFLRVPILPHSLNLYAAELRTLILKGDLRNGFRLSLLPGLATAAAIEQKITGSDKGIW